MAKEESKSPFEAWANNDEDDSQTLTDKGKIPRPLTGSESLNMPLVDNEK
jgi:hypothetical protein